MKEITLESLGVLELNDLAEDIVQDSLRIVGILQVLVDSQDIANFFHVVLNVIVRAFVR